MKNNGFSVKDVAKKFYNVKLYDLNEAGFDQNEILSFVGYEPSDNPKRLLKMNEG